MTRKIIFEL